MDFIAFKDGGLRDDRYRIIDEVEERLPDRPKVNHRQRSVKDYGLTCAQQQDRSQAEGLFTVTPRTVDFRDIVVGQTYTKKVTLTNCTNKLYAFRILPVSPKYKEVLQYEYRLPPKLPSGLSWSVNIRFTPSKEDDLETTIVFRTEQGVFVVPVRAFRRKSVVSASPDKLDYGCVIFGEKLSKRVTLRNDGALAATVSVGGSVRDWTDVLHKNPINGKEESVVVFNPAGYTLTIEPYSASYFDVIFSPHEDVVIDGDIEIRYDVDGSAAVKKIQVRGTGGSLPVHVSSAAEIDFEWCFFETTYCEKITIQNTTNVLTTVIPEVPPTLSSSLSFSPKSVCVQAKSTSEICVFFTPQRGLGHTVQSVILMSVRDQKTPLSVKLNARLTERGFGVSTNELHFGSRSVCEEIVQPLRVENLSDLPQTLGFLTLPDNVKVAPYPIVTLLPKEVMEFKVGVRPPTLGQFTHVVNITNEYDVSRAIQLTGCGCEYPVRFSKSCIDLPACPLGGEINYSVTLQNNGNAQQSFFISSPLEYLRASPSFGTLQGGEHCPIVVFFAPLAQPSTPPLEETMPRPSTKRISRRGREREHTPPLEKVTDSEEACLNELYKAWECNSSGEGWSRHSSFFLKCVVGEAASEQVVMLQINCVVVKPTLSVSLVSRVHQKAVLRKASKRGAKKNERRGVEQSLTLEISPSAVKQSVDFGKVPLNSRVERVFLLRYTGEGSMYLQMRPVAAYSPFFVSKPPQFILSHDEECAVTVCFTPAECGYYREEVVFSSACSNDVTLSLQGSCEPADLLVTGDRELGEQTKSIEVIVLEPAQVGQESRQQLFFHNMSNLPLEVNVAFITGEGKTPAWPEGCSFTFECDQFVIPGRTKVPKTIVFTPQVVGMVSLHLRVSDGSSVQTILVEGRGCDLPVFLTFPSCKELAAGESAPYTGFRKNPFPETGASAIDPVRLYFAAEQTRSISVGSLKAGSSFECIVGGWSETFTENGWKLEPLKITGPAGSHGTFTVSYNPRRDHTDVSFCTFSLAIKCALVPEERVYHVQCTGTA
ncbi:Flagellar-associated PapD-like, putative [Trypanosoma equiperdum]|uniref:Abnormal spindle-like microcephaly-associated protein ASH domain-containing protein n=2 Tax=Trypanozoon TaxID=39700 RepID=Q388P3_TRYB2|nr:hypothetical protein, conserved [Trypanosoma brucei brucei TREU927]EAN78727.1 hypothetical protein, conserved [Trypanosoma brucei brucei TREU927]SCU69300.1 Flagellar-associated PapD-like, putative [Trypanosoma equiperdum]